MTATSFTEGRRTFDYLAPYHVAKKGEGLVNLTQCVLLRGNRIGHHTIQDQYTVDATRNFLDDIAAEGKEGGFNLTVEGTDVLTARLVPRRDPFSKNVMHLRVEPRQFGYHAELSVFVNSHPIPVIPVADTLVREYTVKKRDIEAARHYLGLPPLSDLESKAVRIPVVAAEDNPLMER
jgi:hypothetical protein